jgi:hypothetical protein
MIEEPCPCGATLKEVDQARWISEVSCSMGLLTSSRRLSYGSSESGET